MGIDKENFLTYRHIINTHWGLDVACDMFGGYWFRETYDGVAKDADYWFQDVRFSAEKFLSDFVLVQE